MNNKQVFFWRNEALLAAILLMLLIGGYSILNKQIVTPNALQQTTTPTPATNPSSQACSGKPTPQQTEGPYYKFNTPQRNNIGEGLEGEKLIITGYVFDKNCQPLAKAWLDFWQADSKGVYDNIGYKLRGHQYTDQDGKYNLETIVPSPYENRPPHIHVKIDDLNGKNLTTQLYFPEQLNQTDTIFDQNLVMEVEKTPSQTIARFDFILN